MYVRVDRYIYAHICIYAGMCMFVRIHADEGATPRDGRVFGFSSKFLVFCMEIRHFVFLVVFVEEKKADGERARCLFFLFLVVCYPNTPFVVLGVPS